MENTQTINPPATLEEMGYEEKVLNPAPGVFDAMISYKDGEGRSVLFLKKPNGNFYYILDGLKEPIITAKLHYAISIKLEELSQELKKQNRRRKHLWNKINN